MLGVIVLAGESDDEASPDPVSEDSSVEERNALILKSIPANLRWWLDRVHTPLYVVRRDYRDFSGVLVEVEVEIKTIMVVIEDKKTLYDPDRILHETKCMRIPLSGLSDVQFILDSEVENLEEDDDDG